ncbi:uroporphyrinogen-III synthase, partial [Phascolarctobacterium succinatutens]
VKATGMKPPAIFLVGEVVRLREQLQWFDNKPLFGKTVIVTRARAQASALTKKLEAQGAKVIEAPAIKIVPAADYAPLDNAIAHLDEYKWLVFTSANGVDYFFERLAEAKKDARALASVKLAAIGSATAKALAGHGLTADLIPSAYKAEELAEALAGEITAGDKILLARAKVAREVLPESLRKIGAIVDVVTAYETVADCENKEELIAALESGEASVVTFTSSSTVTNLLEVLGDKKELLNKAALAAIGPVTADTLKKHGYTPAINAAEYTIDGLMTAITNFYNK